MLRPRHILITLAAFSLGTTALAHVFWVQPMQFRAKPGDILKIQLHVGDTFPGEVVPRNDEKIEKFVVIGPMPDVQKAVVGRDADPIAGVFRSTEPGTFLIAYRSKSSPVTLEAEKFETYLREKGLEKIVTKRAELKQSSDPGREIFSRSAKAVLRIGDKSTEGVAAKDMAFRVEIIPKVDPSTLKQGDVLSILVNTEGKPYFNALVQARNASHPESGLVARTDDQGRISFRLSQPGIWVVDTVDMFAAPKDSGADWESVWASLAFEIAGSDDSAPASTPSQTQATRP